MRFYFFNLNESHYPSQYCLKGDIKLSYENFDVFTELKKNLKNANTFIKYIKYIAHQTIKNLAHTK